MKSKQHDQQETDLPADLSNPARRALVAAGYLRLAQIAEHSESELLQMHGFGPKALEQLRRALASNGLSFASGKKARPEL